MDNALTYLDRSFKKLGLELSQEQLEQFYSYFQLLIEKNKVMNLTAITDFEEVVEKHFLDSLAMVYLEKELDEFSLDRSMTLLDLGTGAGFPGVPLKIAFPNLQITLMDSLNKRIQFLSEVVASLELHDVQCVHGRAELTARDSLYREQFNLCTSRAVANISTLSEYCLPFVELGGMFISYKSGQIDEELAKAKSGIGKLGGKVEKIIKFSLPDSDQQRSFVVIRKVKETPKAYPRKAGVPSKKPLR